MSQTQIPTIATKPVESSQIAEIGHDAATNRLAIKFKTGGTYHYENFTPEDFERLQGAESIGSHFFKHIKHAKEKHPYTKVS